MSVVVLCSGGMDSTVLLHDFHQAGEEVFPLFIDYGQHCANTELRLLRAQLPSDMPASLEVINVSEVYAGSRSALIRQRDLWDEDITADDLYLPYRTLLLLTVGASYAQRVGADRVAAAFINSNHAKEVDCSAEFFARLESVFGTYGGVTVVLPFRLMSKADVARRGISLGVSIASTFSCQASGVVACGACPNCVDRLAALKEVVDG